VQLIQITYAIDIYMYKIPLILYLQLLVSCSLGGYSAPAATETACIDCHSAITGRWLQSDHAKAMALPTKQTVLGNFNNTEVLHYLEKVRFFTEKEQFWVEIGQTDTPTRFRVEYTFGHYPLQQYLVKIGSGKLQVLPFSWDARPLNEGGQRWYHVYENEEIKTADRLHWQQPLQNWNGMCADCHSEGLKRNYASDNDTFDTKFDNINVGCVSCHGQMPKHSNASPAESISENNLAAKGFWQRELQRRTATWQGPARDNSFMDSCFACHALRAPLTDGFTADNAFLDQFSPQLLLTPMYHADGQIKEEVYVYGSFLQSKMFANGVNCLDCHDSHTLKLKIQGNGLCLQCHSANTFNVESHLHHQADSEGAQCVNCHMPTQTYMGVDKRRDHSFKIPRPQLSATFDTPNACTQCHSEKTNEWASEHLKKWFGEPSTLSLSQHSLYQLMSGQSINLTEFKGVVNDKSIPVISKASAVQMINLSGVVLEEDTLSTLINSDHALIRVSAAQAASAASSQLKIKILSPLLRDKYKAVRVATARSMLGITLPEDIKANFNSAFAELMSAQQVNSWRGEGRANSAMIALELNQSEQAIAELTQAIQIDPYFEGSYLGLSEIYRQQNSSVKLEVLFKQALSVLPLSAAIHYAQALYLVRKQQHPVALASFKKAYDLLPQNNQYAYAYILSMDGQGQSKKALSTLKMIIKRYADKQNLLELGVYLAQKHQDKRAYQFFTQQLR
jgi:predicted CXXCH cytochrome family protein